MKYPHQPLTLADYNPAYASAFLQEKYMLEEKLGGHCVRIAHIGSTAVPGLCGKPIIDFLIVIDSEDNAKECVALLEGLDYEYMDKPDQYYLRKSTGETTGFHVHMTTPNNPFWQERIAFRDYLVAHPHAREQYATLKRKLVRRFGSDKKAYREGKQDFMKEITQKGLKET